MMRKTTGWLVCVLLVAAGLCGAQENSARESSAELRLRLVSTGPASRHAPPAVIWLSPLEGTSPLPFVPSEKYRLMQKNRTFLPHLLVIPVGSVVDFPNADPFFHNVFSLYEGKRFDLGLYEAGSTRSVTFSREGVSYIFCNIHPEMSAVVIALSTPLYAVAGTDSSFVLRGIPLGDYRLHLWVEGVPQAMLESLGRTLHFSSGVLDLATINVPFGRPDSTNHANEFGHSYDMHTHSPY